MKTDIYWNKNRRCVQLIATPEGGTKTVSPILKRKESLHFNVYRNVYKT